MSIYIQGIQIPKDENGFVKLVIFNDGRCFVAVGDNEVTSKTGTVTARELPPHGRLGDLDVLTDVIERVTWYHQNEEKEMVEGANSSEHQAWYKEQDIYAAIDGAMTIIPADPDG